MRDRSAAPSLKAPSRSPAICTLIDLDGSSRIVGRDVQLTNGLGFSPDDRTLYHSDSRRQTVFCYAVGDDGDLGPKEAFARTDGGAPDGLAVAEDGSVWVAVAGGSGVDVFEPDGRLREHVGIPLPMCTSVCFGGDDLKDLYIVTGSPGAATDREGSVFRTRTEVGGPAGARSQGADRLTGPTRFGD